jgi:hypothetical protein
MNGFEDALKRSGQTRRAANIAAETAMDGQQESASKPSLSDMLRRFTEARNNADYPQALLWLSELRASGQAIPAHFALDQKEADLQQRLREQEDRRRRREVADFQFEFVRAMLEIGDPDDIIQKAVEDIWQVEDGYMPDDLQKPLKKLLPRSDRIEPAASHATSVAVVRRVSRSALARGGCLA